MAANSDKNEPATPSGDDLSALGPDASGTSNSSPPPEHDAIDGMEVGALAALSGAGRLGKAEAAGGSGDDARLNLAAANALERESAGSGVAPVSLGPQQPSRANVAVRPALDGERATAQATSPAVTATTTGARRAWLPLMIGVAVGAVVATLMARSPDSRPPTTSEPTLDSEPSRSTGAIPVAAAQASPAIGTSAADKGASATHAPTVSGTLSASSTANSSPQPPSPVSQPANAASQNHAQRNSASVTPAANSPQPLAASSALHVEQHSSSPAPAAQRAPNAPAASDSAIAKPASTPSAAAMKAAPDDSEEGRLAAAAGPATSHGAFDSVLDDAFASRHAPVAKPVDPNALPIAPSRDDVTKAMTVLVPAIRGCAQGQSGLATATIVVRNDGRVESVAVSGGSFAGTASGRCMEGVVRRAHFPRFRQASFRVQFPFAIQ